MEHATQTDRHLPLTVRQFLSSKKKAEASMSLVERRAITKWSKKGDGSLVGWAGKRIVYDEAVVRAKQVLVELRARQRLAQTR